MHKGHGYRAAKPRGVWNDTDYSHRMPNRWWLQGGFTYRGNFYDIAPRVMTTEANFDPLAVTFTWLAPFESPLPAFQMTAFFIWNTVDPVDFFIIHIQDTLGEYGEARWAYTRPAFGVVSTIQWPVGPTLSYVHTPFFAGAFAPILFALTYNDEP